ncbi:MAG: hypothetical protein JKX97_03565 [Candidatus Lindowbacteria bacterium]|nr:hypothetical protein [Candidatus Lindowbacteria bacterium]
MIDSLKNKSNWKKRAVFFALPILVFSTACQLPGSKIDDGGLDLPVDYVEELQVAPELRIRDLPIPAGYVYRAKESMILEYGSVQAGIIKYEGPDDVGSLIEFFRKEMPKYEWNMDNMIEMEDTTMIFNKSTRTCKISIRPSGGLSKKTIVSVYYAPKET